MALLLEAILFGLILSADSFSAALAMGFKPFTQKQALNFCFLSGLAESLTTLVGIYAGTFIVSHYGFIDHWIAFGLLFAVAAHMLFEGIKGLFFGQNLDQAKPHHSSYKILTVSLVTSLDALGVGIGLGVSQKPLLPFVLAVGASASLATLGGLYLARKLSHSFGASVSLLGSLVLFYMSFQLLKI